MSNSKFALSLLQRLNPKNFTHAKPIHAQLVVNGCEDHSLLGKLLEHYCSSSSSTAESTKLAHSMVFPQFDPLDTFLFNTLLKCSKPEESIGIFTNWASDSRLILDEHTFVFVLGACARFRSVSTLWFGRQVHGMVIKYGLLSDSLLVGTTLIHFYAKNEDLRSARKMFDEMPEKSCVSWNAMIGGYCSRKEKGSDSAHMGLKLFREFMCGDEPFRPSDTTMVCVLSAISRMGFLEMGSLVHGYIEKSGFAPENDVFIGTGLVDMYSKCGCLESAVSVFELMKVKNVLTWTSMATGLALHGRGVETMNLVEKMADSGVKPNEVTFTSLLLACCHVGLVQEGLSLFHSMKERFGIVPAIQHCGCIVDLLGRAGRLKEAYEFISTMPVQPDSILWRSLLNACNVHGDTEMAEKIGKVLIRLDQNDLSFGVDCEDYVALSNVLASEGKWGKVEMLREEMKKRRIKMRKGITPVGKLHSNR
ncbi:PREDICTED: pentatricopeptide repeat-containing protein At3g18970 [Tarenaya hassleriana]|uniref:pentatricopeptide repeat-containing protein At3g18970 n=1 Tax=Tarenaya hassleriana TaxID=28532 RepID=UPI00053CA415|nr:PREDICTED: pentatricopeptide repeat-containing protein At3g18970 [Tarenaya hassleriana]